MGLVSDRLSVDCKDKESVKTVGNDVVVAVGVMVLAHIHGAKHLFIWVWSLQASVRLCD